MEHFTGCNQNLAKKVTGEKFSLTDDPINYYHYAHYNYIHPIDK